MQSSPKNYLLLSTIEIIHYLYLVVLFIASTDVALCSNFHRTRWLVSYTKKEIIYKQINSPINR